jgi:nucleoside-diphosphate-sugar epimerase
MQIIDKTKPVMVTGAAGYVASWLVKRLLEEGLTVHATVRNPNDKEKVKHLDEIAAKTTGKIIYYKADLLQDGSFADAMQGCELVFHTASPFKIRVKDNQKDLVDPALQGTRNVLESVNKTPSVKRVVLTSSVAAVYGDNKDASSIPNNKLNEEYWNTTSSVKHQAYSYSKTVAEKEAWDINKKQTRWDLVIINPGLVFGPSLNPKVTSGSFEVVKQLINGTTMAGVPNLWFGTVDVREIAEAHYKAGFIPEAKGRHIVCNESVTLLDMAKILREKYGNKFPFPKNELPKFLFWLVSPFVGVDRKFVTNNVGYKVFFDNSKSIKELGIKYRPLKDSLLEFFDSQIQSGRIKLKK